MIRRIPVFQQAAVCLTKFGPESGETAKEILARKDLERRSGVGGHKNEFWWGVGEKRTAQSIQTLISQHGSNIVLFSAVKDQTPPNKGSATDALVWRKYRVLGGDILQDIPKHVLITYASLIKGGTIGRMNFYGQLFRFSSQSHCIHSDGWDAVRRKIEKQLRGELKSNEAKDFTEVAQIQLDLAHAQFNAFSGQAKGLSEAYTKTAADAVSKPFKKVA